MRATGCSRTGAIPRHQARGAPLWRTGGELSRELHGVLSRHASARAMSEARSRLIEQHVPEQLAARIASLETLHCALDLVEVAAAARVTIVYAAKAYFELGERIGLTWIKEQIERLPWKAIGRPRRAAPCATTCTHCSARSPPRCSSAGAGTPRHGSISGVDGTPRRSMCSGASSSICAPARRRISPRCRWRCRPCAGWRRNDARDVCRLRISGASICRSASRRDFMLAGHIGIEVESRRGRRGGAARAVRAERQPQGHRIRRQPVFARRADRLGLADPLSGGAASDRRCRDPGVDIRYLAPGARRVARLPQTALRGAVEKFRKMLRRAGRGRIRLQRRYHDGATLATLFHGVFAEPFVRRNMCPEN